MSMKKRIHKVVTDFSLRLGLSFTKAGSRELQNFLNEMTLFGLEVGGPIDYSAHGVLPSRMTISHLAEELGNDMRGSITALLTSERCLAVSVSCDHWTDAANKNQYLGVIAHAVVETETSLEQVHLVLALCKVESKDAANLANDLENVLMSFGISRKVNFMITDGASTNKSLPFSKLGVTRDCWNT